MVILVLGGAWWFRGRPADGDLPTLAVLLIASAAVGSLLQTLLRLEIAARIGPTGAGRLVLTPIGYRVGASSGPGLRGGGGSLRVIGGPPLAVLGAAIGLIVGLEDFQVGRWFTGGAPELVGRLDLTATARIAAWVWLMQGTAMLLPIPGSAGRQILWRVVERVALRRSSRGYHSSRGVVGRRVDQLQGMMAVLLVAVALWLWQRDPIDAVMPVWPFLLALAMLVWSGRGAPAPRPIAAPTPDAKATFRGRRGPATARGLSWWKRLRIRRTQRAEREEAVDAERLDDVLARLHRDGFDSLSAADRSLLRRVSQRLRESRQSAR